MGKPRQPEDKLLQHSLISPIGSSSNGGLSHVIRIVSCIIWALLRLMVRRLACALHDNVLTPRPVLGQSEGSPWYVNGWAEIGYADVVGQLTGERQARGSPPLQSVRVQAPDLFRNPTSASGRIPSAATALHPPHSSRPKPSVRRVRLGRHSSI